MSVIFLVSHHIFLRKKDLVAKTGTDVGWPMGEKDFFSSPKEMHNANPSYFTQIRQR